MKKISEREKRTLLICVAGAALILGYFGVLEPVIRSWKAAKTRLVLLRAEARQLVPDPQDKEYIETEQLIRAIPIMQMPEPEKVQGPLFQEAFTKQLREAGLNSKKLQLTAATGNQSRVGSWRMLRLESQGKGQYDQVLRLLSSLPSNPMYVGIQRLRLQVNQQNRQQMDWELTVFTYAQ